MYASHGGKEAEMIAGHLMAVNEDAFRRSVSSNDPKFKGKPYTGDWNVLGPLNPETSEASDDYQLESPDGVANASEFDLAPFERLPFMESSLLIDEDCLATGKMTTAVDDEDVERGDPIDHLDKSKLESYLALVGATIKPSAISPETIDDIKVRQMEQDTEDEDGYDTDASSEFAAVKRVITAAGPSSETTETTQAESVDRSRDNMSPQVKKLRDEKRAAFQVGRNLLEDDFYSSDEDSSQFGGSAANFAAATTSKFMFKIKSQDEIEQSDDVQSLKSAAQSLKLGASTSFKQLSVCFCF